MGKGIGGHQSAKNKTDEWYTPRSIIKSLGEFDLDPCSPVNRLWDTAKNHFTKLDDGLKREWFGRVYCNPPYGSQTAKWLDKLSHHGNGIGLVFARTETQMFFKYVWPKADSIFFFEGRLFFYDVDGVIAKANAGAPSVLIAYGKNNVDALEYCNLPGKHILINYQPLIVVGISSTWYEVVKIAMKHFGDDELKPVYDMIERIAADKINNNQHWKAKVRQQIQVIRKQKASNNSCEAFYN